jgi:hypothetical protein
MRRRLRAGRPRPGHLRRWRVLWAAVCSAGALLSVVGWLWTPHPASPVTSGSSVSSAANSAGDTSSDREAPDDHRLTRERRVYPYSVVPGGVYTTADIEAAMDAERVVANHYAVVNTRRLQVVRLQQSRRAYVSYRLGDEIFWTRHAGVIPEGEAILTDGVNWVRARCGNRLSESQQVPVNDQEPPAAALDAPLERGPTGALDSSPLVFAVPASSASAAPLPLAFPPGGSAGGGLVPVLYWPDASSPVPDLSQGAEASTPSFTVAPVPGPNQSSGPPLQPPLLPPWVPPFEPPPGPTHEPLVVTPEPPTLLLLGSALAGYLALRRRRCDQRQ